MIVTEYELRANWHKTKDKIITLPQGSVITPSARDFIRSKGIQVRIEGDGIWDINKNTLATAQHSLLSQATVSAGSPSEQTARMTGPADDQARDMSGSDVSAGQTVKPEHFTHLRKSELVSKIHPVIAWRGQLDEFECLLADTQVFFRQQGEDALVEQLEEIAFFARQLMVSEVKQEPFPFTALLGLTPDELRQRSHYPSKYFGVEHSPLSYQHGPVVAKLHLLRAKAREVELAAVRAFTDETGNCLRTDLVQALNRLSSAFYILACQARARMQGEKRVPIGISNRHVHLSRADLEALFGPAYALTIDRELSQPGEFAAKETVALIGPKGCIENVRVLGPLRQKTQVEISVTDCYRLGIKPAVRDSGFHDGTPGLLLVGALGNVELERGVIVAARHIHLHTDEAKEWGLENGARVRVQVKGRRPVIFQDVLIRVSDKYRMEMHLDTDEANAALLDQGSHGVILGVSP